MNGHYKGVDINDTKAETRNTRAETKYTQTETEYTQAETKYTWMDAKYTRMEIEYTWMENKYTRPDTNYTSVFGEKRGLVGNNGELYCRNRKIKYMNVRKVIETIENKSGYFFTESNCKIRIMRLFSS
jgi:hypothetical protein